MSLTQVSEQTRLLVDQAMQLLEIISSLDDDLYNSNKIKEDIENLINIAIGNPTFNNNYILQTLIYTTLNWVLDIELQTESELIQVQNTKKTFVTECQNGDKCINCLCKFKHPITWNVDINFEKHIKILKDMDNITFGFLDIWDKDPIQFKINCDVLIISIPDDFDNTDLSSYSDCKFI